MRTNFFIWGGVLRRVPIAGVGGEGRIGWSSGYPTVVIDADLRSWALPFAIHAGGPLLGRFGFHFRILCVNIGWSRL